MKNAKNPPNPLHLHFKKDSKVSLTIYFVDIEKKLSYNIITARQGVKTILDFQG